VHVTQKTDYAVRAMVELVTATEDEPTTAERLGDRQRIPMESLRNVLADLQRERLVSSRHAPGGGYWLTRAPQDITVADVIRAVDGPLADIDGVPPEEVDYPGPAGPLRDVWLSTRAALRGVLEHVTVAQVASGELPPHVVVDRAGDDFRRRPSPGPYGDSPVDRRAAVIRVPGVELPAEDVAVAAGKHVPIVLRVVYLVAGLGMFVTALGLMKAGATELIPSLEGSVFTDNALSTLGLGWLGACIVLSGSPVAASALALLDGGAIDRTQAFTMLTGSRLGASFVVLVVGVIYAARGKGGASPRAPISIGILALLTTTVVYLPGALVGYVLLDRGAFDGMNVGTSPGLTSTTDKLFGWAVDAVSAVLPGWMLFPVGLVILLIGFQLFDKVLPSVGSESLEHRSDAWYTQKWPMFLLGCGVCLLTLSVSVALTVLVPLVAKGYLRRANTLPYIAGANITTLADTLVAAILLGNQDAVRVVFAVTVTVTVWTLCILTFAYPLLRRVCLGAARRALMSRARLATFVGILFAIPIALIAI
jgi:Rrf2 family protein